MKRVIVEYPGYLTRLGREELKKQFQDWLDGTSPILVLDGGTKATVVDFPDDPAEVEVIVKSDKGGYEYL